MSSVPKSTISRPFAPGLPGWGVWVCSILTLLLLGGAAGCRPSQAVRVNPEVEPPQYRIACTGSFRNCRREVKSVCGREFVVLEQSSNKPEQVEVSESNLSSTGPSQGPVGWRGEMTVQCGRAIKPLRLVREEAPAEPAPAEPVVPAAPTPVPSAPAPQYCVPGVTQACLGPGACSGAQACLPDGSGFGPCDCGSNTPQPVETAPELEPAPALGEPSAPPTSTSP